MKDNDFSTVQLIIRDVAEHEPDHNPDALHISVKALELVLTKHIEPLRDRKNSIVDLQQRLTTAEAGIKWEADRNALLLAELESHESLCGDTPRCPGCGYTEQDCREQMDHHLCGLPEPAPVKPRPIRFADLPEPDWRDPAGRIVFLESENKSLRGNCKAMGKQLRKRGSLRIEAGKKRKDAEMAQLRENMQGWFLLAQDRALQVIELDARIMELEGLIADAQQAFNYDPAGSCYNPGIKFVKPWSERAAAAMSREPATCTWSSVEFSWSSSCGMVGWEFTDGGTPAENGMKFCHCCGKPIHHEIGD